MGQRAGVLWNGSFSYRFSISSRVRQEGVLSPILFTVYIDDLLWELEKQGVSCFWKHHFAGALCYADDIALIAPSVSALCLMLRTRTQFASSHSLIFNASKTQLIKFSCTSSGCDSTEFSFCGERLGYSKSVTHLGHILCSDLSDDLDIIAVKQGMCHKANHMLTIFRPCDPYTKTKLMQSFCLSLYGASLWTASSPDLQSLETAYNNLLRKIWNLPRCCHSAILHRVAGVSSIYNMIITRCRKLVASARRAGSHLLSDVFTEATTLVYTNVGYNSFYADRHWKSYSDSEELCARFICDARMYPELNRLMTLLICAVLNYLYLLVTMYCTSCSVLTIIIIMYLTSVNALFNERSDSSRLGPGVWSRCCISRMAVPRVHAKTLRIHWTSEDFP